MRILLVRHAESEDNVKGLYAGVRDSELTVHGVNQARCLGAHLARHVGPILRIFSSDLKRALHTAEAVLNAQVDAMDAPSPHLTGSLAAAASLSSPSPVAPSASNGPGDFALEKVSALVGLQPVSTRHRGTHTTPLLATVAGFPQRQLGVLHVPELRERNFHSAEGKPCRAGTSLGDAESRESMFSRATVFVKRHISPLLSGLDCNGAAKLRLPWTCHGAIVIVSHGLILKEILRALLDLHGGYELDRPTIPQPGPRPFRSAQLKYLAWPNTGYLDLAVVGPVGGVSDGPNRPVSARIRVDSDIVRNHFEGLKRTGGGIGSTTFDPRQKAITSFFGHATRPLLASVSPSRKRRPDWGERKVLEKKRKRDGQALNPG